MHLQTKRCRCCGKNDFRRLPKEVEVDPFFAQHGLQISCKQQAILPILDWAIKRRINTLPLGLQARADRILTAYRNKLLLTSLSITIPYGMCDQCNFLAPWFKISDDQLSDYYAHYLKEEYKEARTRFQPGYTQIANIMGSDEENRIRQECHTEYLMPFLLNYMDQNKLEIVSLLDYGGGEGGIQPLSEKVQSDIFEIKADYDHNQTNNKKYDCVQCLHVLEHVGDPRHTCLEALEKCKPGGLLCIEVPIEFPGIDEIERGHYPPCHEHINKFCLKSVKEMLQSLDGEIILIKNDEVNFLHLDGLTPVVRAIFKKNQKQPEQDL